MATIEDLLNSIFADQRPAHYAEFEGWVRGSRRFRAFATDYATKIRAKLKGVRDEDGLVELYAELETAMLLLTEAKFTLDYERYAASKQRGPDFTVTYKTHMPFNVEVRRIRSANLADLDETVRIGRLMTVLCEKIGQMPPGILNVLWLVADAASIEADVIAAMTALRGLAERKDEAYFARRGFQSAADFLKYHNQLGAIVLRQGDVRVIWQNAMARHKLPADLINALGRLDR